MYIKISLFQLLLKIGIYNYVIRKIYTTFFINSQFFTKLVIINIPCRLGLKYSRGWRERIQKNRYNMFNYKL